MNRQIESLTPDEQATVARILAHARELGRKYGGDADDSTTPSLAALDAVWSTFTAHLRQSGDDPNFLINIIGIAFGQRLVDELGMAWCYVTDEYGRDIAVVGQPNDVVVCPCNVIAKRWDNGEVDFIAGLYTAMTADVRRILANGG